MTGTFEGDLLRMESALGLGEENPEVSENPNRPVVLVVDDDPRVLDTLRHVLDSRYRVRAFSGGEDLRARWPKDEGAEGAAAILDIKMPKEDGVSVSRHVRRFAPEMPIIFYTAYPGDEETVSRALSPGSAAILRKGCSLSDLQTALRKAIGPDAGAKKEESHV